MFYVLTMPGLALAIAVVRRVSDWLARPAGTPLDAMTVWVRRIRRQVYGACLIAFIVGAALAAPIANLLAIHSTSGLVETFGAGALWTALCFERALLQARKAYPPYATNLLLEGLLRCVVTLLAVGVGLGVTGAAAALLISLPAAIVHAGWAQRRLGAGVAIGARATGEEALNPLGPASIGRARHDALTALGALGLLAVLQNVDVLVLGRHDPGSSGSYGAVSVATKSLVLIAFVLAGFLLPEAATRRAAGHHALSPLLVSLLFIAVPAAALLLAAGFAGHPLLSLAFGKRLAGSSAAFAPLALAMTLLAASVVLTHYLLAAGVRIVILLLFIAAVATTVALAVAGTGPERVAWTDAIAQGVLALALTCLVAVHHRATHTR